MKDVPLAVQTLTQQSAISNQQSAISNQQSAISNQQSAISNQQSAISNQQSAISNQQSAQYNALIVELTHLVNDEAGLWAGGAARTTTTEIIELIRNGNIAIAPRGERLGGSVWTQ